MAFLCALLLLIAVEGADKFKFIYNNDNGAGCDPGNM